MKILVVGSGAREHAILWKLGRDDPSHRLYVAPGNAGTEQCATNLDIAADDISSLLQFAIGEGIQQTIVGPELPLSLGIVNTFRDNGLPVFGPTSQAAQLESSKSFAKEIMNSAGVPTPRSICFTDLPSAASYINQHGCPIVIKADGLAAGKGVTVAFDMGTAMNALNDIFVDQKFGTSGTVVLIEEFVRGQEISVFCFTDGHSISQLVAACDYKRAFDNDEGPNTGGMGGFSPPIMWDRILAEQIATHCIKPVILEMERRRIPYTGVLYGGIILTESGPQVLEFNARFGDPEAQLLLPRLDTSLLAIINAVRDGSIDTCSIEWSDSPTVAVVMAAGGYPDAPQYGQVVVGLPGLADEHLVFHGGTARTSRGLETNGGRVLTVVGRGSTLSYARELAYSAVASINFEGSHYRRDIAAGS